MSRDKLIIEVRTEDKALPEALQNEKLEGVRLSRRVLTCDSPGWMPPAEQVLTYIIETSDTVGWSMLSAWLYDRFKQKPPEKIIINNITVSNSQEMLIVMNNLNEAIGKECIEQPSDGKADDS